MELKGRFNSKMIKKAKFGDVYFDAMGGFESVEKDRIMGNVSYLILAYSVGAYILPLGYRSKGPHLQSFTRPEDAFDAPSVGEDER